MRLNEEHIYDCKRHPLLPTQQRPAAEQIFDFTKYPAEPNLDAYNQCMDSAIQYCIRKLVEQERQRITDFIGKGKKEPTMKVSYSGFTGEIDSLVRTTITVNGLCASRQETAYDLSIYDSEKQVTHSFTGIKLEDVKFLGGAVSFGG